MSGRRRSSVDTTLTQQNIGKFVNINKTNKDKGVEKGDTRTGSEAVDHNRASSTKQLGQPRTIAPNKCLRPASKSPEEVRRPPLKRQNRNNTMATTTHTSKKDKENSSDLGELEKRLLAGFALMIQKEIEPLKSDIKEIKEEQRLNIPGNSTGRCESIARRFNQTDEKHRKLQDRISFLEDQLLEKNMIFQGILESEYEDTKDIKTGIVKAIANTMQGETEEDKTKSAGDTSIASVERMGKYNPLRTRPVKVKFSDKKDVDNLFKNRKKLPRGIYIDKEYSKATEKERRLLRPVIKAARRIDKYKGSCRLDGPQLVIEGKRYHRHNIHTLPDDLNPMEVTSQSNEEVFAFFGELNPLSNFHPCKFTLEGETFNSSEQYIQWTKAKYCGDKIAMDRILNCEDAADCKEVSRDITNLNRKDWIESAETLCFEGIQAKFLQNEHLMEKLLDTGEKTLVEASYDEAWGTGQHLGSRDCLTESKWKTTGILGRILMRIRSEAQTSSIDEVINDNMDTITPVHRDGTIPSDPSTN